MPLFKCSKCACVENTACCLYWCRPDLKKDPLCSACDPRISHWHGMFPQLPARGYKLGSDGFLYHPDQIVAGQLDWNIAHGVLTIVGDA